MTPVQTPDVQLEGDGVARHARRRQVSVLVADMVAYTEFAAQLGDERTYQMMERVHQELNAAVRVHSGTVKDWAGDGVMALFGAPVAIEDAPLRACRAALEIQDRIGALGDHLEAKHGLRPAFRVGVHSGPLVVDTADETEKTAIKALGDTANVAARLQKQASSGSVLISAATQTSVDGYVESEYAGERNLTGKGKGEAIATYRLLAVNEGTTRFDVSRHRGLSALVGRTRELQVLATSWERARHGGLEVIDLVGDAGIGKSRIVHEFCGRLQHGQGHTLVGHCSADGQESPFLPFIEIVRTDFGIPRSAESKEIDVGLRKGIEELGLGSDKYLPYLLNVLGQNVDTTDLKERASEAVGIRTREALLDLLRRRCRLAPLIVQIEDVQWIDTASAELLQICFRDTDIENVLFILTRRPGPIPFWLHEYSAKQLHLSPLCIEDTVALLESRLEKNDRSRSVAYKIAGKAEGNPLFAEELLNYLKSGDGLPADTNDLDDALDAGLVSMTLANLIMDRVDRLGSQSRALLEAAAVLGRHVQGEIVALMAGVESRVGNHFDALVSAELLRPSGSAGNYVFKHGIIHDVVYQSILGQRRAQLHAIAAVTIENHYANRLGEVADTLAHHYARADEPGKAVHFLSVAAENSLNIYALAEAGKRFQAVLSMLAEHPDAGDGALLADVVLGQARVFYFNGDFANLINIVEAYLLRIEAVGDKARIARFLFETGYAHVFAACPNIGRRLLERAIAIGEEIGDDHAIGYGSMGLVWHLTYWTSPTREREQMATALGERAIEIGRRRGDVWLASKAMLALAVDAHIWGRVKQAVGRDLKLIEFSRETGDPRPHTMGFWRLAMARALSGDHEEAVEYADQALALSLSPVDRLYAQCAKGIAFVLGERPADGLDMLAATRARFHGGGIWMTGFIILELPYGLALVMNGYFTDGIRHIKRNERRYKDLGQPFTEAWANYYLGEIYLQTAMSTERPSLSAILNNIGFMLFRAPLAPLLARRHLRAAEEQFRSLNTPAHLAMTLFSLGRLYQLRNRSGTAEAYLQEAYDLAVDEEMTNLCNQTRTRLRHQKGI